MPNNRYNVLWIMTDQHRADCLGFMGHPCVQTPHLDALAKESVVFDRAFCQSPVCIASRGALFTGRYPSSIKIRGMGVLPPSEVTMPEMLQRNGYHTGAFGKVHLTCEQYTMEELGSSVPILDWRAFADEAFIAAIQDDPFKENYGFETHVGCDDLCQGLFNQWLEREAPELLSKSITRYTDMPVPGDVFVSAYPSEYHQSTFIANSCVEYLKQQNSDKPWFAFCSFIAPHHPFEAPADQLARYSFDDVPPAEIKGGVESAFIPEPIVKAVGEMERYSEVAIRRVIHHYLASISLIDDNVGRVIDSLREPFDGAQGGQLDNTIIVFTADHGEFLGNHNLLRKPSMHYDEVMRVPLMIRLPEGIGAGRRVRGSVELVDVMPTCLSLLGIEHHPGIQGRDWSAELSESTEIGRADVYADMHDLNPMRFATGFGPYGAACTLRTNEWKLTAYPTSGIQYGQLFDLSNDPDETRNLYADKGCRSVREEMLWRLYARAFQNTDPLPLRLRQY